MLQLLNSLGERQLFLWENLHVNWFYFRGLFGLLDFLLWTNHSTHIPNHRLRISTLWLQGDSLGFLASWHWCLFWNLLRLLDLLHFLLELSRFLRFGRYGVFGLDVAGVVDVLDDDFLGEGEVWFDTSAPLVGLVVGSPLTAVEVVVALEPLYELEVVPVLGLGELFDLSKP